MALALLMDRRSPANLQMSGDPAITSLRNCSQAPGGPKRTGTGALKLNAHGPNGLLDYKGVDHKPDLD